MLEQLLDEQKYKYTKATVNIPQAGQALATHLERGVNLLGILLSNNSNIDDDYDDGDNEKKRSIRRRM